MGWGGDARGWGGCQGLGRGRQGLGRGRQGRSGSRGKSQVRSGVRPSQTGHLPALGSVHNSSTSHASDQPNTASFIPSERHRYAFHLTSGTAPFQLPAPGLPLQADGRCDPAQRAPSPRPPPVSRAAPQSGPGVSTDRRRSSGRRNICFLWRAASGTAGWPAGAAGPDPANATGRLLWRNRGYVIGFWAQSRTTAARHST